MGRPMHTHEDANVGLCSHMLGMRLLQCQAFHLMAPLNRHHQYDPIHATWPPHDPHASGKDLQRVLSRLQRLLSKANATDLADGQLPAASQSLPDLLEDIRNAFMDPIKETSVRWPQISALPIVLHPIKVPKWYVPFYMALEVRDNHMDGLLHRWREEHGRRRKE